MLNAFKASPRLLLKCQYLLEHTQQPMLQFQVASAIQEAIVREYAEYQEDDVTIFVVWLVQYCIHRTTCLPGELALTGRLQRYIRDAILRAAAVALKRLSMSLTFNITPYIVSLVQNLAERSAPDHTVPPSHIKLKIENHISYLLVRISRHIHPLPNNQTHNIPSPPRTTHPLQSPARFQHPPASMGHPNSSPRNRHLTPPIRHKSRSKGNSLLRNDYQLGLWDRRGNVPESEFWSCDGGESE